MWSWDDVDEGYLEKLIEKHPALVRFINTIEFSHSKAMKAYVTYMTQRVIEMHRILKEDGSFYLHCDPTASHYLKVLLDNIFGRLNFRNEVIWAYRGAGYPKRDFGRRHDVILRYSKGKTYNFNLDNVREPYAETTKQRFKHHIGNKRKHKDFGIQKLHPLGKQPDDWWQIQPIAPSAKERTGYPTQKPLALLNRIIKASSQEGDLVLDPFCGCATTCVAAQQLNRKWIGIDIEKQAASVLIDRLSDDAGLFKDFTHRTDIPKRTDIHEEPITQTIKQRLFKEQNGHCNGCNIELPIHLFEVDHIVPKSRGGGDYYENYQLLCGNCNRIKGARPMEYLRIKIKARQELLKHNFTFGD
jgi:site-specific DNA-methyltransferase (adenine-specific)